jgi:hypothetical protein
MSKFTIEVNEDVSVAPLALALAESGYRLRRQDGTDAVELTETDERRAAIAAARVRSEKMRHEFMERGWEP